MLLGFHPRPQSHSLLQNLENLVNSFSLRPGRTSAARSRGPHASHSPLRSLKPPSKSPPSLSPSSQDLNFRRLTSRVIELTRRRQLRQILREIEKAKKRYGKLSTAVMNAVMEACVHCRDIESSIQVFEEMAKPESCGVDDISYGILLKGLGEARRIDEAFQILESVENGTAVGSPKLSPRLIYGLLNALLEAGDMRRANGLVARYRVVLNKEEDQVLLYNLLMKGYLKTDFPQGALTIRDEILRQGLKPDKVTYNTLVFACVKSGDLDAAFQFITEMKEEAQKANNNEFFPDIVTYTTLLKGLGSKKDLCSVQEIVIEMKSLPDLYIDRTAYTAIVDAMLACGSIQGALCVFGEIIKLANESNNLRPKPHLYLSMMRTFALNGDFDMVKKLHVKMWSDTVGSISLSAQQEADELLMEAAINDNQVDVSKKILLDIIQKRDGLSWNSRGGMTALKVEILSGFTSSLFTPYILPQVTLDDPIEKYMTPFEESNPLPSSLALKKVVMHFFRDSVLPVIDDWGSCVGILHRDDCKMLDAPLSTMMRGPPPCVTTSTSIGRAIDLLLEKKYKMLIIVKNSNAVYETTYSSSSRPVGTFTRDKLCQLTFPAF
ncbi:Aldolase-type TIM barrel-containing protein [Dioscorea alata]|uniref:Aldolase-type TIM barrel-containing protein n=1 Tax=Dioscorea alata TaxID=55571 RepID=A0ACB7WJG4_DIOAL|nr:Aldolase-type TIM barrel-containing protein [Dioscorea alata]